MTADGDSTGGVVSNLDNNTFQTDFVCKVFKTTLLHLPSTVSLKLADLGKLSDPEMPQPYLLTGERKKVT